MTDPTHNVRQPCPLCGETPFEPIRTFDAGVTVGRCSACAAIYTPHRHPRPESLLAAANYERLVWIFEPLASGSKPHCRAKAFKAYLRLVMKHVRGGQLLDVGCAHGFFGVEARKLGFEVTGIEPAAPFARYASEVNGLKVVKGVVAQADLGDSRWDAITFTDSLEYVPDPLADLSRLARHLKNDGVLFVKVPNGATSLMRWRLSSLPGLGRLGRSAFTPNLRVMHYTHRSLAAALRKAGYDILEQGIAPVVDSDPIAWQQVTGLPLESAAPMWFDARGKMARRLGSTLGRFFFLLNPAFDSLSLSIYAVARPRRQLGAR